MLKWFNPFIWMLALKEYTKAHFVAWNLSTVMTWAFSAFPMSLAYPNWARDLSQTLWPEVKQFTVAIGETAWEFFNTS